ncbi:MAG: serine/threonine protein kinase [Halobacteriales archaeon]|nr:serine/threonine protein kinase [Halobacteriales archaeon]
MTLLPDLGHVVDAGSGVLLLALGLWVGRVRNAQRATLALALFSVGFGLMLVFGNVLSGDDPLAPVAQAVSVVLALPAIAGLLALSLLFPRPLSPRERRVAGVLGLGVLAPFAAWLPAYLGEPPVALSLVTGLYPLEFAFAFAILLFAFRFASASGPSAPRERQLCALMAAALLPWPALFAMTRLGGEAGALLRDGNGITVLLTQRPGLLFGLEHFLVLVAACGVWLAHAARAGPPASRTARTVALLTIGAPVLAEAVLASPLNTSGTSGLYGAARIATVAALAYAMLRHRLFDLDLRVKGTMQRGALVAIVIGAFLLAGQAGSMLGGPAAGAALGVLVLAGLVLALRPLEGLAARLADAAMPGVSDTPEYLNLRKLEVYRAALEQAAASGTLGEPGRDGALARLRDELGLSERDHHILAYAARTGAQAAMLELEAGALLLGRYRVQRFLGEGAHGRTYLARDERGGHDVVLKAIRPDKAGDPSLLREARAIAALRHPHVVRLLEAQQARDAVFLVMEFVEGGSLRQRLDRGPLAPHEFGRVASGLLAALGAVHAAGIVHRDVKPSNVLLTANGEAKLADFGIAHLPGLETTVGGASGGSAVGTIKYMSPEQAKGRKVTPRSDLFSAAATLYEAWTGKPYLAPGTRESAIELQMRAAAGQPFRARVEPRALRAWFAKALDPDPARRFPDAEAMRAALDRALRVVPLRPG